MRRAIDCDHHAPRAEIGISTDLRHRPNPTSRKPAAQEAASHVVHASPGDPVADELIDHRDIPEPVVHFGEARIGSEVVPREQPRDGAPVLIRGGAELNPAISRAVDVPWGAQMVAAADPIAVATANCDGRDEGRKHCHRAIERSDIQEGRLANAQCSEDRRCGFSAVNISTIGTLARSGAPPCAPVDAIMPPSACRAVSPAWRVSAGASAPKELKAQTICRAGSSATRSRSCGP